MDIMKPAQMIDTSRRHPIRSMIGRSFLVLAMAPPKRLREAIGKAGERRKQQLAGIIAGLSISPMKVGEARAGATGRSLPAPAKSTVWIQAFSRALGAAAATPLLIGVHGAAHAGPDASTGRAGSAPPLLIAHERLPVMFEMRKEKFFVDYGNGQGDWTEMDVLVREDGFKLMLIGGGREMQSQFRYTDKDLTFDFNAMRYDDHLRPTDTWEVTLGLALRFLSERTGKPVSIEQMHEIARNIDQALRAWPPRLLERDVPINKVRFDMTYWPQWDKKAGTYYER